MPNPGLTPGQLVSASELVGREILKQVQDDIPGDLQEDLHPSCRERLYHIAD